MPAPAQLADADGWRAWSAALLDAPADKGGVALLLAPEGHADGLDADMVARRLGGLAAAWIRIAARPAWWPPAAMAPARCCARWTRAASRWPMK